MLKTQSMNLDLIRTFVVVAQSKDFRDAEKKLSIEYSNIVRHVKKLEEIMGTKLINRNSNTILLTDDGRQLYEGWFQAYNSLLLTEKKYIQGKSINTGKLSIGIAKDIDINVISQKTLEFQKAYPEVTIKILDMSSKELYEKLDACSLDFIIEEKDNDIKKSIPATFKDFYTEKYCLAYDGDKFNCDSIEKLKNVPLILPVRMNKDRFKFETYVKENGIEFKLSAELPNYESIKSYAISGNGVAFLPKRLIENTNLKSSDIDLDKIVSIAYIKSNLSPTGEEFLKLFN